ncbi:sporulation protein [bacterium D16-54]|nr:sporulation protein [bacterium D16-54]RKJ10801.1 sporulation protein [bacterium D16-56]
MVSLFLKITGCVLIVSGASGYGFWMVSNYKERLLLLEQLRQMIFLLKGQILYANATLLEAFDTVGRRTEGPLSELFLQVSERMEGQQGEPFCQIWKEEAERFAGVGLMAKTDRQSLESLGEHLGFLDKEMQEKNLLLYLEQLDMTIEEMRSCQKERCRLYGSLGVMGGLFLAVLLV